MENITEIIKKSNLTAQEIYDLSTDGKFSVSKAVKLIKEQEEAKKELEEIKKTNIY